MGSDSHEQKHHPSQQSEDKERPLPSSRRSSISQPFVLTETVFRIIKDQLIRHFFVRTPYKQLKPRPQYK